MPSSQVLKQLIALNNYLDDSWIGDIIGCACLFGLFIFGTIAAGIFQ